MSGNAGNTIRVRIDATNLAIGATDDAYTSDVNRTSVLIEDNVPAGWTVEEGSFSVQPDAIVAHANGSRTLEWTASLPGAQVSYGDDPSLTTS